MAISNDFQFSQASLQDFDDCNRRFFLRYVEKLSWPAIEAEPALENEKWMYQGAEFHRLVHQWVQGIPTDQLSRIITEDHLRKWWENFLNHMPIDRAKLLFPEQVLAVELAGYPLIAKFDLLVVEDGSALIIFDWKTSQHQVSRRRLAERMQTKVYPFVAAKVGHVLLKGKPIAADMVRLIYWFANRPDQPEIFAYSTDKMRQDEHYIVSKIKEIESKTALEDYPLTEDMQQCRFCVYRSLCDRGQEAGTLDEFREESDIGLEDRLDFEQIQEIEF